MEKELVETFEAAKKAADSAAAGGGSPEVDRCVDALCELRRLPVTMDALVATQVGKRLRTLKKHPNAKIQSVASDLLEFWKNVVIEETTKNENKSSISDDKSSVKAPKSERAETVKVEKPPKDGQVIRANAVTKSESFKVEKTDKYHNVKADKVVKSETVKVEQSVKSDTTTHDRRNGTEAIKAERIPKEEKQAFVAKKAAVPTGTPRLSSMVKCNDPVRDKLRELLAEAFSRVSAETGNDERDHVKNILDEVDACDPIRVAVMVESVMFEKLGRSTGPHKLKYRSIMFNLKDTKNPDLRRRVLLGHVDVERLMDMTPEEMASDERKQSNRQIKEKALFECERAAAPKATTDQFKCGRCGQRKTTYYQLQTRSADEPMTTFVTCVNCNNHWKFC